MSRPGSNHHFDRVIMVDWSANSSPKRGRDSIWIAVGSPADGVEHLVNPPTRSAAMAWLVDLLDTTRHERVLVGFDFSFGYPAGFAAALTGRAQADWADVWRWMAEHLTDDDHNRNNRLDVIAQVNTQLQAAVGSAPFWGYPGRQRSDALGRTKPPSYAPFDQFRLTEHRVRTRGYRPFSAWQLAYNGSVGSQMLLGLRSLHDLRTQALLAGRTRVWPFETGLGATSIELVPGQVLVAEIWPSLIQFDTTAHPVRDAAQVLSMVRHLMTLDAEGALTPWFNPALSGQELVTVLGEEGWTLGVL